MATASPTDFERESRELIEEFLRRDLLSQEATRRVERLYVENRSAEALEVILDDRRGRATDARTESPGREDSALL